MSAFTDAARIDATRQARALAIADMAIVIATKRGKMPLPDGDYMARLVVRIDHETALRANESPTDTKTRRTLSPAQERAMEYLGRLHTGDDAVQWGERPKVGTLVALISRGLITPSPSGSMIGHELTEAGWTHLGM